MQCPKCNSEMDDNCEVCPYCGAIVVGFPTAQLTPADQPQGPAHYSSEPYYGEIKKSHKKAIAIVCACLVLLVGAGYFVIKSFFTRDFLQTIYGKENYAKGLEKQTVQTIGTGTATTFGDISEVAQHEKSDHAYQEDSSINLTLDDTILNSINANAQQSKVYNQILSYINSLKFRTNFNRSGAVSKYDVSVSDNDGSLLSASCFMDEKNEGYLQLPDISKTYFSLNSKMLPSSYMSSYAYDKQKITASMNHLSEVFTKSLDQGTTTIGSESQLKVQNLSCSGEKVTVSLNGSQTSELLGNLVNAVGSDDYFYSLFSANSEGLSKTNLNKSGFMNLSTNQSSSNMTKKEFQDSLNNWYKEQKDSIKKEINKLSFVSYVTAQNQVVGQSVEIASTKHHTVTLNFVTKENGKAVSKAANVLSDGKQVFEAVLDAKSEQEGKITLLFTDETSSKAFGFDVSYQNMKKDKFMGNPTLTGNFTITVDDSKGVLKNMITSQTDANQKQLLLSLLSSSAKVDSSISGTEYKTDVDLNLNGIGRLQVNSTRIQKTVEKAEMPSVPAGSCIRADGSTPTAAEKKLQEDYQRSAVTYVQNAIQKHKDLASIVSMFGISPNMLQQFAQSSDLA